MNKLFTKIASLSIGLALAIGVGVAVGSKEAKVAKADTSESVSVNVGTYATANSWANDKKYGTIEMNSDITLTASGSSNTGKYYTNDNSWRFYANESATLDISAGTGCTLTSVTLTFTVKDNGKISNGNTAMTSGTASTISGSSASLTAGSKSGNKGKVLITAITVNYTKASSDTLNSINLAATSKGTTALGSATVKTDKTLQVYLTANYSSSGAVDKTDDATWTATAGTGTASVNKGLITGLTVGTVTISASFGGKDAVSLTLTVTQGPSVTLSRAQITPFHEKETFNDITITAAHFDGTPTFTASSSSANVTASILANGKLQIVGGNNIEADETVDITVTGDDGVDSASATLKVYLKAPVFTLSAESINLLPSKSDTVTATVDKFLSDVSLSASSSDETVFSVSTSGTTISIQATSKEGNGTVTVTATDGTITRTKTISVKVADVLVYELVTKASDLVEGSKIIVASGTNNVAWGSNGGKFFSAVSATVSDGKITGPSKDVLVADLEGEEGSWYLHTSEGYLSYSGSSNEAYVSETKDDTCSWSITISSGNANLVSNKVSGRKLQYNSSNPRFACYTSSQTAIQLYGILAAGKTIANTRLNTSSGSISAKVNDENWTVEGFVFEVQYEGESSWNTVSPTYTVTESVPTSYSDIGSYPVHFKVTYSGTDYYAGTEFTATVLDDMTPISLFHTNQLDTSTTYTYRGTVIGIEGNSYYLQQDQSGILIYGGTTTPPEGMKIGDLVKVTSKVQNYKGYVVENNGGANTATIMGTGTLPAAPIVTSVSDFNNHPQSTRVTFNGLSRNDEGTSITWTGEWDYKKTDQSAVVKDSSGATITLFVSKYLDSTSASAIIAKVNTITTDDTFDLFQGVKVVSTSDGSSYLSIMSADNITIHTPEEDHVQTWIDLYMEMDNPDFEGDGTGACRDNNYYVNAKAALNALEQEHEGSKASFQSESKYSDALARYLKWAKACHDSQPFVGSTINGSGRFASLLSSGSSATTIIVVVISAISAASIGGYFLFRKKKED